MFEYFQLGGPIMYVLLLCSIVAVAVFIERFIYLIKAKRSIDSLSSEIQSIYVRDSNSVNFAKNIAKDLGNRDNSGNILAGIVLSIIDRFDRSPENIKESAVRKANIEIPKLEKNVSALGVIYNIAPMLGLLGTVLGLTITLQDLVSDPGKLLTGIYVSLITTIAGLVIAIPTHIAHSYLTSKIGKIVLSLENETSHFLERLDK